MSHQITKALRVTFLAMISALAFQIAIQAFIPHLSIWGSHILTILFFCSTAFVVTIRTLHREAEAEDALNAGEQRLKSVLESGLDGFYLVDARGRLLEVNDAYCAMSGYTRKELLQMRVADVECTESEQEVAAHIQRIIRHGKDRFESRHRRKDGQIINIETSVNFQNFNGGRFFCFLRDITERTRAEQALRESEERFRRLLELAPLPLAFVTEEGAITFRNQRFVSVFGYTAEDVPTISEWWHRAYPDPEYRQWALSRWDTVVRAAIADGRDIQPTEANITCKNGKVRIVEVSGITLGDRVLATFIDITERKQAEKSLRGSEERYRMLFDHNLAAVFHSSAGKLLDCNEVMCKMLGYRREELFELDLQELYCNPAARDAGQRLLYATGKLANQQVDLRRKDGSIVTLLANLNLIHGEPGQAPVVVGVMLDITQVSKLQEQLLQSQKMEAVGRLAGGIAHDFNNLLMVIQSYTEMLQDSLPAHNGLRKNTEQILKAANRAASLTGQMLAFSRKQITSPVVLDLNAVINETAKMLKRLIGEDIEFRVDPAESLWAISADSDQIVQILMNLCVNSRDAMPQGGMLTIATANITVEEGSIDGHPDIAPGEYVKLTVTDSGTGICKEEQAQIFEPFFTTKELGKGTGLGLAMIYGIVKQSGGYVWVDSERGQGACFTICLPRSEGVIALDTSAKALAQRRGTGTILIAEDEEALREAICGYLRNLGYTVLAASSGQQALSVAREYGEQIDLLITDVVMPKISGRELSQTLGRLRPRLKTIHMSGYTDDAVLRHGIRDIDATFLQKPFSLSTLARKVLETLGRSESVQ
jgi:PAS domain S-box-containing protein